MQDLTNIHEMSTQFEFLPGPKLKILNPTWFSPRNWNATGFFRHPETERIQIFLDFLEMGQIQMCLEKVELFWRLWEQTFEVKIE